MWKTPLIVFSLLSSVCSGAETLGADKITLSDLDNVISKAAEYDKLREDRLDSCRTTLMKSNAWNRNICFILICVRPSTGTGRILLLSMP